MEHFFQKITGNNLLFNDKYCIVGSNRVLRLNEKLIIVMIINIG